MSLDRVCVLVEFDYRKIERLELGQDDRLVAYDNDDHLFDS